MSTAALLRAERIDQSQQVPLLVTIPTHRTYVRGSQAADASGIAEVRFGPVPVGRVWDVERIIVHVDSANTTTALVFLGDTEIPNLLDGTPSGNLNVADCNPPIHVPDGEYFTIRWTGAVQGELCSARIQIQQGVVVNAVLV